MHFANKNLVWKDSKKTNFLKEKIWQSIGNSISFALIIIALSMILKELLGLIKKS